MRTPPLRSVAATPLFLAALAASAVACGSDDEPIVTAPTPAGGSTAAPTGDGATPATPALTPSGERIEITAENIAFDKDELRAPANEPFTIVFDNSDSGVPHNFALYRDDDDADDEIAATEIDAGPVTQELAVPALDPGRYYFDCQTHPNQMDGQLIAE